MRDSIFKKTELEQELKVKSDRLATLSKQFEKSEPIYPTLERIDQKARQSIDGYMGRFIDYLECSSDKFAPCIDIAAKSVLNSIIVDTLDTAEKIVNLNKEL